jgi:hypothetical protein
VLLACACVQERLGRAAATWPSRARFAARFSLGRGWLRNARVCECVGRARVLRQRALGCARRWECGNTKVRVWLQRACDMAITSQVRRPLLARLWLAVHECENMKDECVTAARARACDMAITSLRRFAACFSERDGSNPQPVPLAGKPPPVPIPLAGKPAVVPLAENPTVPLAGKSAPVPLAGTLAGSASLASPLALSLAEPLVASLAPPLVGRPSAQCPEDISRASSSLESFVTPSTREATCGVLAKWCSSAVVSSSRESFVTLSTSQATWDFVLWRDEGGGRRVVSWHRTFVS